MADEPTPKPLTPAEVPHRLHEIARLLRGTNRLGPEAQQALAQLADELGNALDPATAPAAETARLVDSAAHVAEALHHEHDAGYLGAARQRLEETAAEVEARAPNAADFARRLLDVLANLGI